MNRLLALLLTVVMLTSCRSKQQQAGDANRPLTFEDFKGMFPPAEVPYRLPADSLLKRLPDSLAIKPAVIKQFLTDTLTRADLPKGAAPRYFPLAYFDGPELNYFLVTAVTRAATVAYLCFTDKEGRYLNRIPVGKLAAGSKTRTGFALDSKYLIRVSTEQQVSASHTAMKEDVYTTGADGSLTLIMTNAPEPVTPGQIFNPIDTLPRKHKFSADYTAGDMNIVSIRDGAEPKTFQFFITFSKDKGGCKGELSGTGQFTGSNKGEFKDKESSCGIAFQFSSGRVTIREIGGCGAYRGVRCFFEGNYVKKKSKARG